MRRVGDSGEIACVILADMASIGGSDDTLFSIDSKRLKNEKNAAVFGTFLMPKPRCGLQDARGEALCHFAYIYPRREKRVVTGLPCASVFQALAMQLFIVGGDLHFAQGRTY